MKKLVILRGAPGSGKTTFANRIIENVRRKGQKGSSWEADSYFVKEDGSYQWDPTQLGAAHKWCRDSVDRALKTDDVVIVANTNIRKRDVDTYVKIAQDNGAQVEIYRLINKFANVHGVPAEAVQRMRDSLESVNGEIIINQNGTV